MDRPIRRPQMEPKGPNERVLSNQGPLQHRQDPSEESKIQRGLEALLSSVYHMPKTQKTLGKPNEKE